jgi:hypothetical protein
VPQFDPTGQTYIVRVKAFSIVGISAPFPFTTLAPLNGLIIERLKFELHGKGVMGQLLRFAPSNTQLAT